MKFGNLRIRNSLVKKKTGIPARTCPEFHVDSGSNPPELLLAFRWNSRLLRLEFHRNHCQHSSGIPADYCRQCPGIPPELLLAFC